MRNLHPAGGGASKKSLVWKYEGPHGAGEVRLSRCNKKSDRQDEWESLAFIAPAAAWVFYLDELQDGMIMNADTCVKQLYQSLWIFSIGALVGFSSIGVGMLIAWMSSASLVVRLVGLSLTFFRGLIILWRWAADLFMSNHHRGATLRGGNLAEGKKISCNVYRRENRLDAFPQTKFPRSFSQQTPGAQVKTFLHVYSQRTASVLQSSWLDWCASRYYVEFDENHPGGGPTVQLNVLVNDKSHYITVPEYIAEGLEGGTRQPGGLAWLSVAVTVAYIGLIIAEIVLVVLKGISAVSASVWGGASIFAIVATAWLGGSPLVCSGIADDVDRYSISKYHELM